MDTRQAKEILARYRPGETLGDSQVGEALELARRDPQLAAWLAKQLAAQASGELAAETVPAQPDRIHPVNKALMIGVGLVLLVLLALFAWSLTISKPRDPYITYRSRMTRIVQRAYPMQTTFTDQTQIRQYFRTNGGPVAFSLPHNLEKLPAKGCAVFTWQNNPVGLMDLEAGGNTNLFLFLIPRVAFEDTAVPSSPEYMRVGKLGTLSWTLGGRIYLLAGPSDAALLKNYAE